MRGARCSSDAVRAEDVDALWAEENDLWMAGTDDKGLEMIVGEPRGVGDSERGEVRDTSSQRLPEGPLNSRGVLQLQPRQARWQAPLQQPEYSS